jgi:hypothetical protein
VRRVVIGAVLVLMPVATGTAHAASPPRTGSDVVTVLEARRLSLSDTTIKGDIDFRGLDVVDHAFSCRNCTIEGRVLGDDVVFDAPLDLSGAVIADSVSMSRATFRGSVLFASTPGENGRSASFIGAADFSYARFEDLATFLDASLHQNGDFTAAQFGGASVFAGAVFKTSAVFQRTSFVGSTDFRDATFAGPASFDAARFERDADFSVATFANTTSFERSKFGRDATFYGTLFTYDGGDSAGLFFGSAAAERDLVFDLAQFSGGAIFLQTVAAGAMSFREAVFDSPTPKSVVFEGASARGLLMDVEEAMRVVEPDNRERALSMIEAGAKSRGDLGVANDARFTLEVLESRSEPWYRRVPNIVFYRWLAGYFVRPQNPIAALLALVIVVSLVRVLKGTLTERRLATRAFIVVQRFGHEFLDSLALITPGGDTPERRSRRVESLAYRVLAVCALIGLANSNPTLREMFDAVV